MIPKPELDLQYVPGTPPSFDILPAGQGPFSSYFNTGYIAAKARVLPPDVWDVVRSGRGRATECADNSTSISKYTTAWASNPPHSPLVWPRSKNMPAADHVQLIPFGSTNIRIAEFPTYLQ